MVVTVGLEPTVSLRFARSVKFAIGVQPPWSGVCTCCSLRFRLASSATGGARLRAPLDVFTSQMIIGSESKYDQDKNQDHREGDPDFCVVTVGLEPTTPSM